MDTNDTSKTKNKMPESDPFNFDDDFDFGESQSTIESDSSETQAEQSNPLHKSDPFAFDEDTEFNFGQLQPSNHSESDGEQISQLEYSGFMECVCPKCSGNNEIEFARIPEEGLETKCSSCNKKIHVIRENSACRAKRKAAEINCVRCGKHLDHHLHCPSCGLLFPDYFITINPEDARRKARSESINNAWASIKALNFSIKPNFERTPKGFEYDYSASSTSAAERPSISKYLTRRVVTLFSSLAVVIAMIVVGIYAFNTYKAGKVYSENYFKTLYCMKTGIESNINTCVAMKTEWESATLSGRSFTPSFSSKDETKSIKLRSEVEKLLKTVSNPPGKLAQANNKLLEINKIYIESETLLQSTPTSPQDLSKTLDSLTKRMGTASQALKTDLPEPLKTELEKAKLKYRGMKDF